MKRYFEYKDDKSSKFWEIVLEGQNIITRYGKIGANGQQSSKSFASDEVAKKEYEKLVTEKTRKGYVEALAKIAQDAGNTDSIGKQKKEKVDVDFDALKSKIEFAAQNAFTEVFEKYGSEEIYGFALYSDDGAMTVCPATNTLKTLEDYPPEDLTYYKFEPAEWRYEAVGAEKEFDEICTWLRTELKKFDDDDKGFEKFQNKLYETCIEVLEKLKNENYFKQKTGKDIFLNFTVSEYDFKTKEIKNIIERLNDNNYKDEYFKWMKTWGK